MSRAGQRVPRGRTGYPGEVGPPTASRTGSRTRPCTPLYAPPGSAVPGVRGRERLVPLERIPRHRRVRRRPGDGRRADRPPAASDRGHRRHTWEPGSRPLRFLGALTTPVRHGRPAPPCPPSPDLSMTHGDRGKRTGAATARVGADGGRDARAAHSPRAVRGLSSRPSSPLLEPGPEDEGRSRGSPQIPAPASRRSGSFLPSRTRTGTRNQGRGLPSSRAGRMRIRVPVSRTRTSQAAARSRVMRRQPAFLCSRRSWTPAVRVPSCCS